MALFHARPMSTPVRLAVGAATLAGAGAIAATSLAGTAAGQPSDGNSGDVKVDGVPFDNDNNNEPHVGCEFRLKFFNFAPDQYPVTFTAQAPTDSNRVLLTDTVTVNQDPTFSRTYNFSELDFDGIQPQPQQGFHVKVTVDTGQGAGKHKVFWIKCVQPSPTKTKTMSPKPTMSKTKTTAPPKTSEVPATATVKPGEMPVTGGDMSSLLLAAGGLATAGSGLLLFARRLRRRTDS